MSKDAAKEKKGMTYSRALWRTIRYRVADALGLRIRPRKLRIAVTKRCNSRCAMCNTWKNGDAHAPEISVEEIRTIAERNRRFFGRVTHVSFTGGEPTLRRDLAKLVRAAHDAFPRASFNVNTNGFNTERVLMVVSDVLGFHRRLDVMISLDGLGEAHNTVRGVPGVFPRVVDTIDRLNEMHEGGRKVSVEVNFVLTNRNSDQLLPVFHFCRERGLDFNPIYPVYGQLYGNEDVELALDRATVRRFLADLAEIEKFEDTLELRELGHQLRGFPRDYDCWAGRSLFLIESDCRVFPNGGCPSKFCLGGLREFDYRFDRLLRSHPARRVLGQLRQCRLCRIPCETMTTLGGPEALTAWRKMHAPRPEPVEPPPAAPRPTERSSRQRTS